MSEAQRRHWTTAAPTQTHYHQFNTPYTSVTPSSPELNMRQPYIINAINKAWHLPYSANAAICANKGPPRGTLAHLCRAASCWVPRVSEGASGHHGRHVRKGDYQARKINGRSKRRLGDGRRGKDGERGFAKERS